MDGKFRVGHGLPRLAVLWVLSLGVFFHSRVARADEDLPLRLVWVNTVTEFPLAFDVMAGEVSFIFGGMGIDVIWSDTPSAVLDQSIPRLSVVLTQAEPSTRGLKQTTMGVAPRDGGSGASVCIFLRSVLRVLGFDLKRGQQVSPEDRRAIARAVARVATHEVIHVLDPDPGHASRGIVRAKLDRHFLRQARVHVWPATVRVVRAGLRALGTKPMVTTATAP